MTEKEAIEWLIPPTNCSNGDENDPIRKHWIAYNMAIKALEQEPKIIRCKDCKQFRRWVDTDITFCGLTESPVFETDFCSKAESEG